MTIEGLLKGYWCHSSDTVMLSSAYSYIRAHGITHILLDTENMKLQFFHFLRCYYLIFSMWCSICVMSTTPNQSRDPSCFGKPVLWLCEASYNSFDNGGNFVIPLTKIFALVVSRSNPRFFGGYELNGAHNFSFGRSGLKIGTRGLHGYRKDWLIGHRSIINNS